MNSKALIKDSWPYKVDFEEIEKLEIDYYPAKILYKSLFSFFRLPSIVLLSFLTILTANIGVKLKNSTAIGKAENYFFRIFDEAYSLNDMEGRESTFEKFTRKN